MARYGIAGLIVEMELSGRTKQQAEPYRTEEAGEADIIIRFNYEKLLASNPEMTDRNLAEYMGTGALFAGELLRYDGFQLHSSAIVLDGKAYLFSAPSGTGKSTHGKMWQQLYGEAAVTVINDDKPSLRLMDGKWYAYGTPWCGKDGINKNIKVPVGGICFLEQAPENRIRRLQPVESIGRIIDQSNWHVESHEAMHLLLGHLDKLLKTIPVYLLECTPTTDAAKLSSETMLQGAIDAGL